MKKYFDSDILLLIKPSLSSRSRATSRHCFLHVYYHDRRQQQQRWHHQGRAQAPRQDAAAAPSAAAAATAIGDLRLHGRVDRQRRLLHVQALPRLHG